MVRKRIHRKHLLVGAILVLALAAVLLLWRYPSSEPFPPSDPQEAALSPAGPGATDASAPFAATTLLPGAAGAEPLPAVADILEEIGDLSAPGARERATERIRQVEERRRALARDEARRRGLPLRIESPDGRVQELAGFENGRPVYFTTHNTHAAISTGANLLRLAPYSLDGAGLTIGMWDGGAGRASHQEFASGSRLVVRDGAAVIDHATHVAGTLAAAGVSASARGMATAARVDSYDWNQDKSEMTARAAASPNEAGALLLSNHSYGYISGWNRVNGAGSPARTWEWWGDGTSASGYEHDFGRYNSFARDSDAIAHSAPYFLMFRSAGNEGTDNPANGAAVALSPGSSTVVSYNASVHPPGDGGYRGGFETIGFDAVAKNVVTVGSVTDAVLNGVRNPSVAALNDFSSRGPTDDGRIKPDLVANGDRLRSSLGSSNTAYGELSGTSMSSPNAAGTAALLAQEYARLFPGGAMRSSTLRGLLIHTADDLGHPGPDYRFGWGLVNGVAAADLVRDHAANPLKARLREDLLNSSNPTRSLEFVWDGVSPIRVTLAWTDPAGAATNTNDLRTPRLVNNLDLRVVGPDGSEHLPWTMPFVGAWTQAAMDQPATRGLNHTDNVERVDIPSPGAPGVYRCVVSHRGALANNQQHYSLLVSGSANQAPPPPSLALESVSPAVALPGPVTVEIAGTGFAEGLGVSLVRAGQPDRDATDVVLLGPTRARVSFDLSGIAVGVWGIRASRTGGESATLANAFTVLGAIWSESFDGIFPGWSVVSARGSNRWDPVTTRSHSPPVSAFATGPSNRTTTHLQSPAIEIPGNASNLQLKFWHRFDLQSERDGGRLEMSLNNGAAWFGIDDANSGAAFASNGYTGTIRGSIMNSSDFAGRRAWTGSSGGFVETVVNLTDTAKFAGASLRLRWSLATNSSTASAGWWVDSISLVGGGDLANQAPAITSPASADSGESEVDLEDGTVHFIVRGASVGLSVSATDDGGDAALVYTWSGLREGGGEAPSFERNEGNEAKSTTAWFESAGDYLFTVTVKDEQGLAASSSVNVRVLQTAGALSVDPPVASLTVGGTQTFSGAVLDQFGDPVGGGASGLVWSASGGGTIDAAGVFAAAVAGGPFIVTAASGGLQGIAAVTVNRAPAEVLLGGLVQTFDRRPRPVEVATNPPGLAVEVLYDGSPDPPVAVGSYEVEAIVSDAAYQGAANGTLVIEQRGFVDYGDWADFFELTGEDAAADADPDGDGISNLLEYATGGDPLAFTPPFVVSVEPDGAEPPVERLTLRLRRHLDRPGVGLRFWASADLVTWDELTELEAESEPGAEVEILTVRDTEPASVRRRFLRVEAFALP
jgi:hypothetical protein